MIDAGLWFMFPDGAMKHTLLGPGIERPFTLYETYRIWETADGHVTYYLGTQDQALLALRAIGRADLLEDPRFQLDTIVWAELGRILEKALRSMTTEEVVARFQAEELPVAPVLELDEVFEYEQIVHNGIVGEEDHPVFGRYRFVRPPARFSSTPATAATAPPLLGEHGDEILRDLGFDDAAIAKLCEDGVLKVQNSIE